ncbi:MAG: hypothetical protein AAB325_02630, partial [Pseudomonadota bacterium]
QVVDEEAPDEFLALTGAATPEAVTPAPAILAPAVPVPRVFSEQEMQQLLHQLEARLETMITGKLRHHLEQLQQQAVEQTVNELKASLPELMRDALNTHPESR